MNTTKEEFDINDHAFLINQMEQALEIMPIRTYISTKLDDGTIIALYKDPKSNLHWHWKPKGGKFSRQLRLSRAF